MAEFITRNFCTGHLFMASLAAVHNFGVCAFPILGPAQLNVHCLFLSRVLQVPRKKLNLVLQCHELKLQELKQKFCLDLQSTCSFSTLFLLERGKE